MKTIKVLTDSITGQFSLEGDTEWTWDLASQTWVNHSSGAVLTSHELRLEAWTCEVNDGGGNCACCGRLLPDGHECMTEPNSPIMFDTCARTECNTTIAANSIHRG